MASGASGRVNPGSKGFDFGSDDILCSYDDFTNHDSSNGSNSDPAIGASNSNKVNTLILLDRRILLIFGDSRVLILF